MQKKVLKRYPSTCRSDSDEVLTFLSDDDIDTAVYNLFQFYSKPVEVEDENGNKIIETRVYKKDLPTQAEIGKQLKMTDKTYRTKLKYLTSPSLKNPYCPYILQSDDKKYYTLLLKEEYFTYIPLPVVQYLMAGYSNYALKAYIFLLTMDRLMKKKHRKFTFTLTELGRQIGFDTSNISGKAYLYNFNIEKAATDPKYKLGILPVALLALKKGNLIDFKKAHDKKGHNFYQLEWVNDDIKDILRGLKIETVEATPEDREASKIEIQKSTPIAYADKIDFEF